MRTLIVATPQFEAIWPLVVDRLHELIEPVAEVSVVRPGTMSSVVDAVADPDRVERLIALGVGLTKGDLDAFPALREVVNDRAYDRGPHDLDDQFAARGIRHVRHASEGYWAQSVAEFALGLTIAGLRRIAQMHHSVVAGAADAWDFHHFAQYSDDNRFTNGTVHGKRVRIVGAGNIASRYASFVHALGADVAAWDPFAAEPAFHRSGARREQALERLVEDAEIFVPMVPLTPSTRDLVTAEHIRGLPAGCLVVQVTRARIVDVAELRRRVVGDELSLAADVFDIEPLPDRDPLIGRSNVVHTPHIAGRTKESNYAWAQLLVEQFAEFDWRSVPPPGPQRRE